jgi:hypothetical protein
MGIMKRFYSNKKDCEDIIKGKDKKKKEKEKVTKEESIDEQFEQDIKNEE